MLQLPPLGLYVHLPWCVRKCPYCDFNSHEAGEDAPFSDYVDALLSDLETELPLVWGRTVHSIFFGGGTPSLFNAEQMDRLIGGIRGRVPLSPAAEITMEANPGTTEYDSFSAYKQAGINRVSLGVQSFDDELLRGIGRIHGRAEVDRALESLRRAELENFNVDLMFGLPGQTLEQGIEDANLAVASGASHVSHYQLTLEPNTAFHARPPALPPEEDSWSIQEEAAAALTESGFRQYEISAWSREKTQCRHNVNYWRFGDYIGIGAGAHGKITLPSSGTIQRRIRTRHPKAWMSGVGSGNALAAVNDLSEAERLFEYFLNHLRLKRPVKANEFEARTGLSWNQVAPLAEKGIEKGLLTWREEGLETTETGWRFNNETQALFLP